jgi:hypothetical protein
MHLRRQHLNFIWNVVTLALGLWLILTQNFVCGGSLENQRLSTKEQPFWTTKSCMTAVVGVHKVIVEELFEYRINCSYKEFMDSTRCSPLEGPRTHHPHCHPTPGVQRSIRHWILCFELVVYSTKLTPV